MAEDIKTHIPDYENLKVLETLKRLGPYNYGSITNDGVNREKKDMVLLESKSSYEGQWNIQTGDIDGVGVFISPDGSIYEG